MPLRRASPEPSPRLRALLDSIDARSPSRDDVGDVAAGDPSAEAATGPRSEPAVSGAAVSGAAGSAAAGAEPAVSGAAGAGAAVSGAAGADGAGGDSPWLPQRSWVAAVAHPAAARNQVGHPQTTRPGRHRRLGPPPPALLMVPEALRGARLRVPRLATLGLLIVLALTAAGFGIRVAWARAASAPHAVGRPAPRAVSTGQSSVAGSAVVPGAGRDAFASTTGRAGAPKTGATGPPGTNSGSTLTVHVVGQVVRPGVFRLPTGSRVTDAVASAGGPRPGADLAAINLARPLVDGEQVRVPMPGETPAPAEGAAGAAGGAGRAAAGGAPSSGPVNLNSASLADLDQLPGVGPVLAQRILDWRTEHQRFASVDELGEVSGIGDKLLAQLRPKVVV